MVLSCKSAEQKRQEKNRKKRTSCWPLVRLTNVGFIDTTENLGGGGVGIHGDPTSQNLRGGGGGPEPGPPLDLCMNIIVCLSSLQTGN